MANNYCLTVDDTFKVVDLHRISWVWSGQARR